MRSLAEIAAQYDTDKASSRGYVEDFEAAFGPRRQRPTAVLELGIFHGGSLQLWRDYFAAGPVVGLDLNSVEVPDPSGRIKTYAGSQDDLALLDRIRTEAAPDGFDIIIDDCSHLGSLTKASFWHLYPNHLRAGGVYVIEDWGTGYWDKWPDGRHAAPEVLHPESQKGRSRGGSGGVAGGVAAGVAAGLGHGPGPIGKAGRKWSRALARERFRSHDYGMVGFVKQLVDECAMADVTARGRGGLEPSRLSQIARLSITTGHVFVFKPGPAGETEAPR
jgi:SAM-dependent methyltransferase